MFNDKYSLTQAVLDGRKIMTRRFINGNYTSIIISEGKYLGVIGNEEDYVRIIPRYQIGEVVAIAQSYETMFHAGNCPNDFFVDSSTINKKYCGAGFANKLFVKSELMIHHIRITYIKAERLQNISDEDCLKEGIYKGQCGSADTHFMDAYYYKGDIQPYCTPREAFAALIDKVSGKGTWESNPYVFAYEFELID